MLKEDIVKKIGIFEFGVGECILNIITFYVALLPTVKKNWDYN